MTGLVLSARPLFAAGLQSCIVVCRVGVAALQTAGFGDGADVRARCCPADPVEVRLPFVVPKPAVTSLLLLFWTAGDLSATGTCEAEVLFCVVVLGEVRWFCMFRMTDLRVWFSFESVWVCC